MINKLEFSHIKLSKSIVFFLNCDIIGNNLNIVVGGSIYPNTLFFIKWGTYEKGK